MLYNKDLNRKINEKKVLHKVKKHWVVVSVAILGLMGATGVTKNSIHASSVNANHQNHNLVQTNANQKNQAQTLIKPQTNQSSLHLGPVTGQQAQSVHQPKLDQITKQTDVLRNRILAQVNQNSQTPQQHLNRSNVNVSQHAADYYGRSTSASTNNVSVTSSQVSHAASSAQQHQQVVNLAKQQMKQLGQEEPAQTENLGASPMTVDDFDSEADDINDFYSSIGNSASAFKNYQSVMESASNVADAEINRYSGIDPKSIDFNIHHDTYGSTSDYRFTDSSDAATSCQNSINSAMSTVAHNRITTDYMTASFIADSATDLEDKVTSSNVQNYASTINSMYNSVSAFVTQDSDALSNVSNTVDYVDNQTSDVINYFHSVASQANSAGKALYNNGNIATGGEIDNAYTTYPVVNVTNAVELANAMGNKNIHQVNMMNNIDMWDTNITGDSDWWIDTHCRNMKVNGLNNDGSWNTIDLAGYNFNFNQDTVGKTELVMKNLHMYGIDYYGTFDVNSQPSGDPNITIYKNISYVGSQLGYNEGYTSGIFEGNNAVLNGASYSPDGKYTKYDYYSPGLAKGKHLSPHPFAGDGHVDEDPKKPLKALSPSKILKGPYQGQTIADYDGYPSGAGTWISQTYHKTQNGVPDIAVPVTNPDDLDDNGQQIAMDGINMIGNQQIIQISGNQSTVFKPNCRFDGSTVDGDCFAISGNGNIYVDRDAYVHLTPRGINAEDVDSGGTNNTLPSGIDVRGSGIISVNNGATLKITPRVDTDNYNHTNFGIYSAHYSGAYAPGAINFCQSTGSRLNVHNGASVLVDYPDLSKFTNVSHQVGNGTTVDHTVKGYSLPDSSLNVSYSPQGAISMQGNSSIVASPYSHLIVNGENPTAAAQSGAPGSLVTYGTSGTGASTGVDAQTESDIELITGGKQQMMLFIAGKGTKITVVNPKQFSLDFYKNDNPASQLASPGVGIQGLDVTVYDDHLNQKNQFDHLFGQYNQVVFPSGIFPLPTAMKNAANQQIEDTYIAIVNWLNSNGDGAGVSKVLSSKQQVIDGTDKILPFALGALPNSDSQELFKKFSDSIDLPDTIVRTVQSSINAVSNGSLHQYVPNPIGEDDVRSILSQIPGYVKKYGTTDDSTNVNMKYNGQIIRIRQGGFNIEKGFAFKEVPHTNVEGIKVTKDNQGNPILSGYAIPGSYIRVNKGNDASTSQAYDPSRPGTPVVAPGEPTYSTRESFDGQPAYDPDDPYDKAYPKTYVAIANKTGYWSCRLPSSYQLPTNYNRGESKKELAKNPPLVVTAHTDSVLSRNAARWVAPYDEGLSDVNNTRDVVDKNKDSADESNTFDSHEGNFPPDTYPTINNEAPANAQNGVATPDKNPADKNQSWYGQPVPDYGDYDPTFTDDDDDITVSVSTDNSNKISFLPVRDVGNGPIRKGSDSQDDYNAGFYFQAGRLKGIHDIEHLDTDPSVYGMPFPFIVGYETATAPGMDAKQMEANIDQIIAYVQNIKDIVVNNYLPEVEKDKNSANTSMADINETVSNLDSLLDQAVDPYLNLAPLSGDFINPSSSDQGYDNQINDEYNSVSGIDDQLGDILNTLYNDKLNITDFGHRYNRYIQLAKQAASQGNEDVQKNVYLGQAKDFVSEGNDVVSSASSEESSANSYDSHASIYNQSASSNSNSMVSSYDYIRGTASNSEAADYNSVAQSYSGSAQLDSSDVYRDSTEVSHRDRQLSVANGILDDDEAQINEITNSLENYVPVLSSLSGLGGAVGTKLSASYSSDYRAANRALYFLTKLESNATNEESSDNGNSSTANQDSDAATSASNDVANHAQTLSTEAKLVSQFESAQNSLVSNSSFDQAQFINNEAAQSLDSVTDSQASSDVSLASSAWVEIHNLHDKIANVATAVEGAIPTFETDIQDYTQLAQPSSTSQASSQSASQITSSAQSSKRSQDSNSAANHGDVARDRYQGTLTVTVQDEDAGGHPTSRDIETVAVDQQLGTRLTLDPQQYRPAGFHLAADDRPISVRVTRQGAVPQNVTFRYRIDHDNDSNGVPQSASQVASVTSDPMSVRQPSSVSIASDSSSSQSTDNEEAPIWIDGTPNESSNASLNNNASASVTSFNAVQSSASAVPQLAESESVSELQSDSSSTNSSIAVRSQTDRSLVEKSAWSSLSSAVSHSSSLVSHLASSSVASSRGAQRSSLAVIRHQFLQHYEHRALGIPSSARNQGARIADRYIAGINDARKDVRANTKDSFYHKGRRAFKEARIRSMASQPRQIHEHWTLGAVLMLILYTILRGWVAADHRRNEE